MGSVILGAVVGVKTISEIEDLCISLAEADINWLSNVGGKGRVCRLPVLPPDLVNER